MTRLSLHVPGEDDPRFVDIAPEQGAMIGRAPEDRLPPRATSAKRLEPYQVAAPSVSSQHVAAWVEGGSTRLLDVGSKNGTWLRLPEHRQVTVEGDNPLALHLAMATDAHHADAEIADASWTSVADFGPAVLRRIGEFLDTQGIPVSLALIPATIGQAAGSAAHGDPWRISLATGQLLQVVPSATVDKEWLDRMTELVRFVARQNLRFDTEQAAREEGQVLASPAIRAVLHQVVDAAKRSARGLLIIGPTGAGKEAMARAFHRNSGRTGAFVALNCAMFSLDFLRAELFGAEKGSFTGCTQRIIGAVERAHGGTLFLDELGEMAREVQPMLLRFLDRGEYERLGEYGRPRQSDVTIVAATNRNLREASLKGDFRMDLWFRLSVHVAEIPPLRDRVEDLVAYLKVCPLRGAASVHDALTPAALDLLRAHSWDGNFRELQNVVARLPIEATPNSLDAAACRAALSQSVLVPLAADKTARTPEITSSRSIPDLTAQALAAFAEDYAHDFPASWDEVKELVEKYIKPLLLGHLAGVNEWVAEETVDVSAIARRIQADRGTIKSQLARLRERFGKGGAPQTPDHSERAADKTPGY